MRLTCLRVGRNLGAEALSFQLPDAVEAIKYHMDQNGLQPRDLIPFWQPQPGTRGAQSQALADTQNDLATA